jgi:adenylosuccinate lyase
MVNVISELNINTEKIMSNLNMTMGQIYAEFVLEALVKKGVPRFEAYRDIQRVAFEAIESGNHFFDAIKEDSNLAKSLSSMELKTIFNAKNHLSASLKIIDNVAKLVKNTKNKYCGH